MVYTAERAILRSLRPHLLSMQACHSVSPLSRAPRSYCSHRPHTCLLQYSGKAHSLSKQSWRSDL